VAWLPGCSAAEQRELLGYELDVLEDSLGEVAAPTSASVGPTGTAIDVEFEGDARHVLAAVVDALDAHPALHVTSLRYRGDEAAFGRRRWGESRAPLELRLRCRLAADGTFGNALVAFPGLWLFLPIWLGYRWDAAITVEVRVVRTGEPAAIGPGAERTVTVAFRERSSRRSALFHLWPSTGTLGIQFVLALVLAPTFWFYEGEETTPALVQALSPRLGRYFAQFAVDEALAVGAPPPGPAPTDPR
jgi:hypothetical protein